MFRIVLLMLVLSSCAKESTINENFCKQCEQVSESNLYEADLRCGGYANNYPSGVREEAVVPLGQVCGSKYQELIRILPVSTTTRNQCGLTVSTKSYIRCK